MSFKDKVELAKIFTRSSKFAIVAASALSALGGAAVTAAVSMKYFEKKYRELAEEEIENTKHFYAIRHKEKEFSDPVDLVRAYEDDAEETEAGTVDESRTQSEMLKEAAHILTEQSYTTYNNPPQSEEEKVDVQASIRRNIFDNKAPTYSTVFDLDDELDKKNDGKPYIIEIEEYMSGDSGCSQICMTYYEEDDVLVDELDHVIEDYERTIGDDNLKFGRGSKDNNVVYIRNDDREEEYEIVRNKRSFATEVGGAELQHSYEPKVRKFLKNEY